MHMPQFPPAPRSFDEARRVLSVRPMGALPMQLRHFGLALRGAERGIDAVQPIVADLAVGTYLDLPGGDMAVSADQLAQWGVTLSQTLDAAVAAGFGRPVPQAQRVETVHLYRDVRFAGTTLLRPELVRDLPVDGNPVILVPTVGDLLVGGADDPAGLMFMVRMAERLGQSNALPVSIQPLVLRGPGWAPFEWPASARPYADALRRRWDSLQYAAQQPLLRQHYERIGTPYFVPDLQLFTTAGETISVTTLTEGVPSVLPLADVVNLVRDEGRLTRAPMEQLFRMPGLLTPVPNTAPPRVFATRFPVELTR